MPVFGVCGPICSGKDVAVEYLRTQHSCTLIECCETIKASTSVTVFKVDGETLTGVSELVNFVTRNWRKRYVLNNFSDPTLRDALSKRPFFLLVYLDAPILTRYERYVKSKRPYNITLEMFCRMQDSAAFNPIDGVNKHRAFANVYINNDSSEKPQLWEKLKRADLMNGDRFRPCWDAYFMQLASLASMRSNCMKRRVGCVLVRDQRVIATGYNGTPRGLRNCNEGGCTRCNSAAKSGIGLGTCLCLHAEENALLEAGRERIGDRGILYCNTCPCLTCSVKIAQVGISEVVYSTSYSMDNQSADILKAGGVVLRQFVPPLTDVF
ncbi:deoxycytidylate deaminase [Schizosaccharomyces japonicus yFS275]|uniref:Deoxycytidylate deaminase n=1 Tax=Schizosaccharomyces japonicus (strain yFS275 / FY16936) TaxID=402676 RepID=B6K504_SCHJY|nr:deoxycytidylate deaminase [Schizosaccharomyces japonicus yFS275]EEB08608.2 deoxycytidylate deaminase [Schizosaccharomyces japonicus yFS275]